MILFGLQLSVALFKTSAMSPNLIDLIGKPHHF